MLLLSLRRALVAPWVGQSKHPLPRESTSSEASRESFSHHHRRDRRLDQTVDVCKLSRDLGQSSYLLRKTDGDPQTRSSAGLYLLPLGFLLLPLLLLLALLALLSLLPTLLLSGP